MAFDIDLRGVIAEQTFDIIRILRITMDRDKRDDARLSIDRSTSDQFIDHREKLRTVLLRNDDRSPFFFF